MEVVGASSVVRTRAVADVGVADGRDQGLRVHVLKEQSPHCVLNACTGLTCATSPGAFGITKEHPKCRFLHFR